MKSSHHDITRNLQQLGYDRKFNTSLSSSEYTTVVREINTAVGHRSSKARRRTIKKAIASIIGDKHFYDKVAKANRIHIIKHALSIIGKRLNMTLSMSAGDYIEVIDYMVHQSIKEANRLVPWLTTYVFDGYE